jgi:hypothetical protein
LDLHWFTWENLSIHKKNRIKSNLKNKNNVVIK